MAFKLPAKTNPLSALFDLDHLALIGNRELIVTLFDARQSARRALDDDTRVQSVNMIIVSAWGHAQLLCFERNREHHKILWDFGKV